MLKQTLSTASKAVSDLCKEVASVIVANGGYVDTDNAEYDTIFAYVYDRYDCVNEVKVDAIKVEDSTLYLLVNGEWTELGVDVLVVQTIFSIAESIMQYIDIDSLYDC